MSGTTFEPGKTYRTRDGREARIYATGCGGLCWNVHGAVKEPDGDWRPLSWHADGRWADDHHERPHDLLPPAPPAPPAAPAPETERLSGWVNVYAGGVCGGFIYPTKDQADHRDSLDRIACIDLSQHRKGEGL